MNRSRTEAETLQDVMLMRGHAIQRLYDHRVEPFGLRIAATARFIEPPPALEMQQTVP